MVNLYRLGTAILVILTLGMLYAPKAHALVPTSTQYRVAGSNLEWQSSFLGACAAGAASPSSGGATMHGESSETQCTWTTPSRPGGFGVGIETRVACPADSVASGGGCACVLPKVENPAHTSCIDPPNQCQQKMGQTPIGGECKGSSCQYTYKVDSPNNGVTVSPVGRYCQSGCVVKGDINFCGQQSTGIVRGVCEITGSFYTGAQCDGASSTETTSQGSSGSGTGTGTPSPERVPPGKCPGQVNGMDVIVNCDTGVSTTTSSSTTTVAGSSTSGTGTGNGGNETAPGMTIQDEQKQTQCTGTTCTTTTTTTKTNPDGSTGTSTTTKGESKDDFCAKNPKSPLCVTGQFGGSCGGGGSFTCEGDAVQCAMAKEQHIRNCSLFDKQTDESAIYNDKKGKEGKQRGDDDTVAMGADRFDSSNALGTGASCVTDQNITIQLWGSHSISATLQLSRVCPFLDWIGAANLAAAFLLAAVITFRG